MNLRLGFALVQQETSPYKTVSGSLVDILADRIISGVYPPGMQLRQDKLAHDLETSRSPVREALTQLEGLGLVTNIPRKGKVVSSLSRSQVDQLFELRALLEGELLRLALPELRKADLQAAVSANDELRALSPVLDSVSEWAKLNLEFHLALYKPAKRSVWLELYQQLHSHSYRYRRVQLQHQPTDIVNVVEDHDELLEHVRRGNVDRAVDNLRAHILSAHIRIAEFWDSSPERAAKVAGVGDD